MRSYELSAKQYKDDISSNIIEDGDVFVAISAHSWREPKPFGIQLFSGEKKKKLVYRVFLGPSDLDPATSRTITFGTNSPTGTVYSNIISREDRNTVVRIMKTTNTFVTYVNGHYIQPTGECHNITQPEDRTISGASFNAWNLWASVGETVFIYCFDSSSSDSEFLPRIEALEKHMKNPVNSFWEGADKNGRHAPEEKECFARLKRSWDEMGKSFRRHEMSFLEMGEKLGMKEWLGFDEAGPEQDNAGIGTGTGADGTDRPSGACHHSHSNISRGLDVHPPDADYVQLYATIAWPRSVKHVLGATLFNDIQQRHNQLMNEWVISRGDNISSEAYDYLVYSRWVGWPEVVLEVSSEEELARVRARCEEIMKVLF